MGSCARLAYVFVRLYQVTLGRLWGGRCRFSPSCSAYALDALEARPFGAAVLLVVRRLLRCHPWHPGGHDPVAPASLRRAPSPFLFEATHVHE